MTFRTKDGKSISLPAHEFLARFMSHVLPAGFVKIRHYGLMASSHATTTLEAARQLLNHARGTNSHHDTPAPPVAGTDLAWRELLRELTGVDVRRCPACGAMAVLRQPLAALARAPPQAA